jgi:hypothetical protein
MNEPLETQSSSWLGGLAESFKRFWFTPADPATPRTELANLSRPCRFHHRYKHAHDLRLVGEGAHKRFVTPHGLPPPDDG